MLISNFIDDINTNSMWLKYLGKRLSMNAMDDIQRNIYIEIELFSSGRYPGEQRRDVLLPKGIRNSIGRDSEAFRRELLR